MERLKQTENKSYEGGNPDWINEKLPSYKISESRYLDVFDDSCDSIPNPTNCYELYYEHEKDIYNWFLNHENSNRSIYDELFVDNLKLCCGKNQYGPNCDTCKVVSADGTVCDGKGECRGENTRMGDGTCECQSSYMGERCESCAPGHFQESNGQCLACHIACKNGCTAFSESACIGNECNEGYEAIGEDGCKKIDFCANQTLSNCKLGEFCVNLNTKFECRKCDKSCEGCSGPTNKDCYTCAFGYTVGNRSCDKLQSKRSKYRFIKYEEENTPTESTETQQNVDDNKGEKSSNVGKKKKDNKKDKHSSNDDDDDKKNNDKKIKDYKKKKDKKRKKSKSKKEDKKNKKTNPLYERLTVKAESDDVLDEL